jgi:hypothetical protein
MDRQFVLVKLNQVAKRKKLKKENNGSRRFT